MQTGIPTKFNLSKAPKITLVKQVKIIIDYPNTPIQDRYYFDYDAEINNSTITGIKVNESVALGIGNFTAFTNINNVQRQNISIVQFIYGSFLLTLKSKFDNSLVENYPVYALAMRNDFTPIVGGVNDFTGVRRFNLQADLSKSYVTIADKTIAQATWISFDIYYQPKN